MKSPPPDQRFITQHPTLAASALVFLFVIIKVLRIAGGDPTNALGVLRASGPADVVMGLLVLSLPPWALAFSFVGVGWIALTWYKYLRTRAPTNLTATATATVSVIALVVIGLALTQVPAEFSAFWQSFVGRATNSVVALLGGLVGVLFKLLDLRRLTEGDGRETASRRAASDAEAGPPELTIESTSRPATQPLGQSPASERTDFVSLSAWVVLSVLFWALYLSSALSNQPWVPLERLQTTTTACEGYVLRSGDWVPVLSRDSRNLVLLTPDDISSRRIVYDSSAGVAECRSQ